MRAKTQQQARLVVVSYHHKNTEKIAKVIAEVLNAPIASPEDVDPAALQEVELLGLGSGIYGEKHHETLLAFGRGLPPVTGKRAFIFSTSAIITNRKVASDHAALRELLAAKGYTIVDEFSCRGFNTNSFLKYLGGMNKGRPNAEDLDHARSFARRLKEKGLDA